MSRLLLLSSVCRISSSHVCDDSVSTISAKVLASLGRNLKTKCETYHDPYLAAIFMLNNYNFITQKLRRYDGSTTLTDRERQLAAVCDYALLFYSVKS